MAELRTPGRLVVTSFLGELWTPLLYLGPAAGRTVQGVLSVVFSLGLLLGALRTIKVLVESIGDSPYLRARPAARGVLPLLRRLLEISLLAIAAVTALQSFGLEVTSLLAGLGIGGLAVALAAQKTVEHLFGGVMLSVDQPMRVGDLVKIGDILGTVDLQRHRSGLPLRLHWLFGYLFDRSSELLASQDCMAAGSAQCLATRLISTAAYDVGQPRLRLGLGADALFQVHRKLQLGPLVAYHLDLITGDGDPVLRELLRLQGVTDDVDERLAQWLTLGARLHLTLPMTVELGMQFGLQSAGYATGAKLNQVSGYGALSWELELLSGGDGASQAETAPVMTEQLIHHWKMAEADALLATENRDRPVVTELTREENGQRRIARVARHPIGGASGKRAQDS